MTAKLQPSRCKYCDAQFSNAKKTFCGSSCRNRFRRGVPIEKSFRPEPVLLLSDHREWRSLDRFPNYEVSNDGRVRRRVAGSNKKIGDLLRCELNQNGYPHYRLLRSDGRHLNIRAHRLVALAFLAPPQPHQTMVLHWDDNELNVCDGNLRWGNSQDNSDDAKRNDRIARGPALAELQKAGRKAAADRRAP